jgi:hypothetical protein
MSATPILYKARVKGVHVGMKLSYLQYLTHESRYLCAVSAF